MSEAKKKYEMVEEDSRHGAEVYETLREAIALYREDELAGGHWSAAWMLELKPDVDGRLVLGKMKLLNELERQLCPFDGIVLLNRDAWQAMPRHMRLALMHHELLHVAPVIDEAGDQAVDGHQRLRWRTRKHNLEEFREVVAAHGCYKDDIREFVEAAIGPSSAPVKPKQINLSDVLDEVAAHVNAGALDGDGITATMTVHHGEEVGDGDAE